MTKSSMQLNAKIRNISEKDPRKSQALLKTFFMERFLERIANSEYRDNFVLKGGLLVSAMIGQSLRSTIDIDTTVRNIPLNSTETEKIIKDIISIKLDDNVTFKIKSRVDIMEEFEYPGQRFKIEASLEKTRDTIKIDISTNDVITPHPVVTEYKLMFEERSIQIYTYNLETVLAEKLQTVLARNVGNTRMKDFYDIHMIMEHRFKDIDISNLRQAFEKTANKRNTQINIKEFSEILEEIKHSSELNNLWESYKSRSFYVGDYSWNEVIASTSRLYSLALAQDDQFHSSGDRNRIDVRAETSAYLERKALRAANPPKTLSQKIEDATKRSREKKAAAPPRPKPTDHKPKR